MPAVGFWLATNPTGTTGSKSSVRVPTTSPAATIACRADDSSLFLRSGTGTVPGPVATVTFTVVPVSTLVPGAGSWVRIVPSGWSDDVTPVGVRVSPSAWACWPATVELRPTKVGTVTCSIGCRPPDASWKTMNAIAARATTARAPASHTSGLVPPGSSSGGVVSTGGGTTGGGAAPPSDPA